MSLWFAHFCRAFYLQAFRWRFIEKVKSLKVGDPTDSNTNLGAIVSKQHYDKILSYIDLAKSEEGNILTGGKPINPGGECRDGYFIEPTVVEGLDPYCRTNQEEVFGPFVSLTPFDTKEEVLTYANSTEYGLAATVWTSDIKRTSICSKIRVRNSLA